MKYDISGVTVVPLNNNSFDRVFYKPKKLNNSEKLSIV